MIAPWIQFSKIDEGGLKNLKGQFCQEDYELENKILSNNEMNKKLTENKETLKESINEVKKMKIRRIVEENSTICIIWNESKAKINPNIFMNTKTLLIIEISPLNSNYLKVEIIPLYYDKIQRTGEEGQENQSKQNKVFFHILGRTSVLDEKILPVMIRRSIIYCSQLCHTKSNAKKKYFSNFIIRCNEIREIKHKILHDQFTKSINNKK